MQTVGLILKDKADDKGAEVVKKADSTPKAEDILEIKTKAKKK